jgi:hypothetical protein
MDFFLLLSGLCYLLLCCIAPPTPSQSCFVSLCLPPPRLRPSSAMRTSAAPIIQQPVPTPSTLASSDSSTPAVCLSSLFSHPARGAFVEHGGHTSTSSSRPWPRVPRSTASVSPHTQLRSSVSACQRSSLALRPYAGVPRTPSLLSSPGCVSRAPAFFASSSPATSFDPTSTTTITFGHPRYFFSGHPGIPVRQGGLCRPAVGREAEPGHRAPFPPRLAGTA